MPAGVTSAMAAQQPPAPSAPHAPAQTTPPQTSPPPPPGDTDPPTPTDEPTTQPPTTQPPSEPADPSTPDTTPSDGSSPTDQPSDPPEDRQELTTDPPPEQSQALEKVTTTLEQRRAEVPEELTPSVDSLIATLRAVEDPSTSPQDRGAVTESAEALAATLAVISDDGTSGAVRDQLTGIVKQVASTLEAGRGLDGAPEDRSRLFVVVKRTTGALDTIADPETPEKQSEHLTTIVEDVNYAVEQGNGAGDIGATSVPVSSSLGFLTAPKASQQESGSSQEHLSPTQGVRGEYNEQQQELGEATAQVSQAMRQATDPKSSPEDRADAQGEMKERTTRMKDEQEESGSSQDPPDAALGAAAEVCTNAIFEVVSDRKISNGLRDMTPSAWNSTGVKDFWKAQQEGDDVLDVRAQLRNDEHSHGPFAVGRLIEQLATVVPGKELTQTVGNAALHCTQAALYLEEDGITVGSWLASAGG
ncbi:hypothetical protein [Streptomyces sp. NPDC098781]|uniref:hypothetical protein n=1 Tax=Streptomyces sp. NPDC098781 TaxID=3366097 RepID=UPI003816B04C